MQKRSSRGGWLIASFLILISLVLGGFVAMNYLRYRDVAARLPEISAPIRINILNPIEGSESAAGEPVLVDASSLGPAPVLSLELWANGKLVGVQAGPTEGITPFNATFAWIPTDAGNYALIVRAHDNEQRTAASDTLNVIVLESVKTDQSNAAQTSGNPSFFANGTGGDGLSPAGPQEENEPAVPLPDAPSPPSPNDSITSAKPWLADPLNWISQIAVNKLPAAPELAAVVNGCGATLNIHDLSANEEGFFVYRQGPDIPGWKRIATLDAQSQSDWLTFDDGGYPGAITYYVASFNDQGESAGNLASVQVNPTNCPTISPAAQVVAVQLTGLQIDAGADKAYCYQSLGGVDWMRVPATGFFLPGANGFDTKSLTQNILLNSQPNNALSSLDLECWGWFGDQLQFLGKLHQDGMDLQVQRDVALGDAGLFANYTFNPGPVFKPLDIGGTGPQQPSEWFDLRMPPIIAFASTDVEDCRDNLSTKPAIPLEALLFCTPYPEYTPNPQPYLWWAVWEAGCDKAGAPDSSTNCKSMDWYRQRAEMYGGQLGFRIWYEHVDGPFAGIGNIDYVFNPYNRKAYAVPPLDPYDPFANQANLCGVKTRYWVQPFYDAGPNDPTYANILAVSPNPGSADFVFPCYEPPTQVAIDVTIDTMHLGNLDDGGPLHDDISVALELYGSFQVNTSSSLSGSAWGIRNLGEWGYGEDCPNDNFTGGTEGSGFVRCSEPFTYGDYNFKELGLCQSDSYLDCIFGGNPTQYLLNNNTIRIMVKEGDAIIMHTTLIDYDTDSPNDNVCTGTIATAHKSLDTWLKTDGIWTMAQPDNGNASCQMHFRLKAVQP